MYIYIYSMCKYIHFFFDFSINLTINFCQMNLRHTITYSKGQHNLYERNHPSIGRAEIVIHSRYAVLQNWVLPNL